MFDLLHWNIQPFAKEFIEKGLSRADEYAADKMGFELAGKLMHI